MNCVWGESHRALFLCGTDRPGSTDRHCASIQPLPQRPLRPCSQTGCGAVTRDRYCLVHTQPVATDYDKARGSAAARGYDRRWRKLRGLVLARDCHFCQAPGCGQEASEVDHIIPKRKGGTDALDNLQSLCKPHHSAKTRRDDAR